MRVMPRARYRPENTAIPPDLHLNVSKTEEYHELNGHLDLENDTLAIHSNLFSMSHLYPY